MLHETVGDPEWQCLTDLIQLTVRILKSSDLPAKREVRSMIIDVWKQTAVVEYVVASDRSTKYPVTLV